jgi:hypothetical protein
VPYMGTFVVASSTVIYAGCDPNTARPDSMGLYKVTSATGGVTGTWALTTWPASGANYKRPGTDVTGVHGLTGRLENGTFILYFTTSVPGNALYRYNTSFDTSSTAGAGFTLLATAPSNTAWHGVFCVPVTPSPTPPPWQAGDVLVLRVNDNMYSTSSSQAVYLDEVDAATGSVVSVTGPLLGNTPNSRGIALSQQNWWDGWMQLSPDGGVLTFLALDVAPNTAWPSSTYSTAKVVVAVYPNGTVDSSTYSDGMLAGANFMLNTAVATSSGATLGTPGYYATGPSLLTCDTYAGVRYLPPGTGGTNTQVRRGGSGFSMIKGMANVLCRRRR